MATARDIARAMRPRYDAAASNEDRRQVLEAWDQELDAADPDTPGRDDLDDALEQAWASWERRRLGRR